LDSNIAAADLDELQPTTYVDQSNLSYRLDGNNVDINTESAELAKNQLRFYTLLDSMTQEFNRLKSVMTKN
ncbi:MAG: flagellar basal body rod protein FlgB, partial [Lachnospiraceae bacterium]|nr:flagellar basal body rod protein FlgB [Lachnospiraceae bacterium]